MNIHTHNTRRGFTLVELVIAFTVLSLILGAIGLVNLAGRDAYHEGVQSATRAARARRALQRLVNELTAVSGGSLTAISTLQPGVTNPFDPIDNPRGVSSIRFRTRLGYAAGAPIQSTWTELRLENDPNDANDNIDNDDDGLVDERQLVLVRNSGDANEVRLVLLSNVAEYLEGETVNTADDNGNGLIDEPGFVVTSDGVDTLRMRLSIAGRDPKNNLVTRTVETSVNMRNF